MFNHPQGVPRFLLHFCVLSSTLFGVVFHFSEKASLLGKYSYWKLMVLFSWRLNIFPMYASMIEVVGEFALTFPNGFCSRISMGDSRERSSSVRAPLFVMFPSPQLRMN